MKKNLAPIMLIVGVLGLCALPIALIDTGCTTSQQTTTYKSIAATETAVLSANAAYLDSVVTGHTPTNSVPTVESAFNDTQMALHLAAAVASGGTNAPTPPAVAVKANDFITQAKALTH